MSKNILTFFVFFCYLFSTSQEVTFTKITEGPIVNDGGWNYGMLWSDFNNDDYPDLFVTNNDANNSKLNFLYLNNGDGTFEKVTEGPVVIDGGSSYAATAVDFNEDGYTDIFVANHNENNFLYLGNGDGSFEKVLDDPIVTTGGKSVGCSWADYNLDGLLDLYVANRDQKNFLFKKIEDGSFEKILIGAIVNDIANSSGCVWGDYDIDGYPDLYVANSGSASCLYHNNGDGTFTKIEDEPFISDISSCSGASWGDCDNDGDLDLYISTGQLGMYNNWFYENNADGTFTKIIDSPLVNEATWSAGSAWGDYDKDGDLDLIVGGYDGDNFLFKNDGSGNFEKVEDNTFVNDGGYTEGLAWADADKDGDLDIFTAKNNYFGGNNSYFLNDGNDNNWLKVKVQGDGLYHNFQAIGAKIYVYSTIFNEVVCQFREVNTQSGGGQGGQNELIQFFGLGDATSVDSVVVNWLNIDFFEQDIEVNQTLEMYLEISDIKYTEATNPMYLFVYPNPATSNITFSFGKDHTSSANLAIYNLHGEIVKKINIPNDNTLKKLKWNLLDNSNTPIPPGTYTCQFISDTHIGVCKFVVVR